MAYVVFNFIIHWIEIMLSNYSTGLANCDLVDDDVLNNLYSYVDICMALWIYI
jgi:hypothetical protein